jgi:hypothetical protein
MSKTPATEIRLGLIKATIWENESKQHGRFYRVTLTRLYRDGAGWKESTRFDRDDLPLVAKVSDQAHSWIFAKQQGG